MGWLKFGRKKEPQPTTAAAEAATCLHAALAPRWDRAEDIGHDDRATSFHCDACNATFTSEQTAVLREREAERLRK